MVESLSSARAKKANNNRLWTPVDCLKETIKLIESKEISCNKLIAFLIDDTPEEYGFEWLSANISATETLVAATVLKASVLKKMGY